MSLTSKVSTQTYQPKLIKFAQPLYDIQDFAYQRINKSNTLKDRKLLQFLGTDWGRQIDENLWVDLWRQEARSHMFKVSNLTSQIVITDDLRFDNEAKQVLDLGGRVINVECDETSRRERSPSTFSGSNHSSESGITDSYISLRISNNSTIQELGREVERTIRGELWS